MKRFNTSKNIKVCSYTALTKCGKHVVICSLGCETVNFALILLGILMVIGPEGRWAWIQRPHNQHGRSEWKRLNERILSHQRRPHLVMKLHISSLFWFYFFFCCCVPKMPVMFSFAWFLLVAVRYIASNKYPAAPAQEVFSDTAHNIPTAIMFNAPRKEKKTPQQQQHASIFDDSGSYAVWFCRQHSEINLR